MKQSLENSLESLKKPDVSVPLHQSALKRGLLASKKATSFSLSMNLFKLVPAGAALTLVLALLLYTPSGTSLDPFVTPKANAQEVLANVVTSFQALTDEEVEDLNLRLNVPDVRNLLMEARDAADLHLAEEWSFNTEATDGGPTLFVGEGGSFTFNEGAIFEDPDTLNKNTLSALSFTRVDGSKVDIVIDTEKGYLPLFILILQPEIVNESGESEQTFEFIAPSGQQ